jgi:hypothetical protein
MQHLKASVFKLLGSLTEAQLSSQRHKEEQRLLGSSALTLIRLRLEGA